MRDVFSIPTFLVPHLLALKRRSGDLPPLFPGMVRTLLANRDPLVAKLWKKTGNIQKVTNLLSNLIVLERHVVISCNFIGLKSPKNG